MTAPNSDDARWARPGLVAGVSPPSRDPLHVCLARLRTRRGDVCGAGFLVTDRLVCTCAHVVAEALGGSAMARKPPTDRIEVDFPFLGDRVYGARVKTWRPAGGPQPTDVALLVLDGSPPSGARPARWGTPRMVRGHEFRVCGFPEGSDAGVWARGVLDERRSDGTVQIEREGSGGFRVQPGFSGAPVWDARERCVVGMVVSSWREREVGAAFMIPVDTLMSVDGDFRPNATGGPWALLTGGVTRELKGLEDFLAVYLGQPGHRVAFGGRGQELALLDRWLSDPEVPYLLLVADGGRGKSALVTQWALETAETGRAAVALVPITSRFDTNLAQQTLGLMIERVKYLIGEELRSDSPDVWRAELQDILRARRDPDEPLMIVLDGVDEAAAWHPESEVPFPSYPVLGLKVLVSARRLGNRDAQGWLRALGWQGLAQTIDELAPLDRDGIAEVLGAEGKAPEIAGSVVDALARVTNGDPLLVALYAQAIGTGGFITPERLNQLADGGLRDLFQEWWDFQKVSWRSENRDPLGESEETEQVLATLATALGPLPRDELANLAGIRGRQALDRKLAELNRWVVPSTVGEGPADKGYVFTHPRLTDYFRDGLLKSQRRDVDGRFLRFCQAQLEDLTAGADVGTVSSYAVRHYGAHLLRTGNDGQAALHALITPAWGRAWEALENGYGGFLEDVRRAWQHADQMATQHATWHECGHAFGLQMRYALVTASVHSLAAHTSPVLLRAVVEADPGRWPAVWAVNQLRQIPTEAQLWQALWTLAPCLRGGVLGDALNLARTLKNDWGRFQALAALAEQESSDEHRTAVLAEALNALRCVCQEDRAQALGELVQRLPEALLGEALDIARATDEAWYQSESLAPLAEALPEELIAKEIARARRRGQGVPVGPVLAGRLPDELLDEAGEVAVTIGDLQVRAETLAALAERLPEDTRMKTFHCALEAASAIHDDWERSYALERLAARLPVELVEKALNIARERSPEYRTPGALAAYSTKLPAARRMGLNAEALDIVRSLEDAQEQKLALETISEHLPDELVRDALEIVQAMSSEGYRVDALAAIAPRLPEDLATEALDIARKTRRADWRAEALAALAERLPGGGHG